MSRTFAASVALAALSLSAVALSAVALSAVALSAVALSAVAVAQAAPPVTPMTPEKNPGYVQVRPEADFIRRTEMVPMRDGVKLFTVIVMKKGTTNGPILLNRTPYNADRTTKRMASQKIVDILPVMDAEFVNDGYIRVYQDIRGRDKSDRSAGRLTTRRLMNRQMHMTPSTGW
jgi:uncharacterized protein